MRWLAAIIALFVAGWFRQPPSFEWFSGESMVIAILALHAGHAESRSFRNKSIFALLCLAMWADLLEYLLWLYFDVRQEFFAATLMLYLPWLTWVWMREYDIRSDEINHNHVCLLFLRPKGFFGVFKSFFGLPFSSICIAVDCRVWAFRASKGFFASAPYTETWLKNHLLIDTGVVVTPAIRAALQRLEGVRRFPYSKCLWSIRGVLALLGGKYTIRSIFDYIPGVYAVRVLRER